MSSQTTRRGLPSIFRFWTWPAILLHIRTDGFSRGEPIPAYFHTLDLSFSKTSANKARRKPTELGSLQHGDEGRKVLDGRYSIGLRIYGAAAALAVNAPTEISWPIVAQPKLKLSCSKSSQTETLTAWSKSSSSAWDPLRFRPAAADMICMARSYQAIKDKGNGQMAGRTPKEPQTDAGYLTVATT